jgi:hypothetical protein
MAADFYMVKGDRLPLLDATLTLPSGDAIDLTAKTVVFSFRESSRSAPVRTAPASVASPATAGNVTYTWLAGDTDKAGKYIGEFLVTDGAGKIMSFPSNKYIEFEIRERV